MRSSLSRLRCWCLRFIKLLVIIESGIEWLVSSMHLVDRILLLIKFKQIQISNLFSTITCDSVRKPYFRTKSHKCTICKILTWWGFCGCGACESITVFELTPLACASLPSPPDVPTPSTFPPSAAEAPTPYPALAPEIQYI